MNITEFPIDLNLLAATADTEALRAAAEIRKRALDLSADEKYEAALDLTVDALRSLRAHSDYSDLQFKAVLAILLQDLAELHFALKDYKQSEKELEMLFKVLEALIKEDAERFGPMHVMAMELSTRILRSRKKTLDLLAKQQINTGVLYEKVSAGVATATDKLVDSLRKAAEMMAQTGDYRGAVRFYMEAIKLAKKRSGRVTRREIRMTLDMVRVMMHSRSELARARRLLEAVTPHAVALENVELEQEISDLTARIDADVAHEPAWRTFIEKLQHTAKSRFSRNKGDSAEETEPETGEKEKED